MYFLEGAAINLQTIMVLAQAHLPEGEPLTESTVARAYRGYLADLQPGVPSTPTAETFLVRDEPQAQFLADLFGLQGSPAETRQKAVMEKPSMDDRKVAFFEEGLKRLAQYDPELSALFQMAVKSIFSTPVSPIAGSMTVRAALGVMWVYPLATWATDDLIEAYVHELTHTLVMLDERRFTHYPHYDELDREENLVNSAIRNEKRSLFASVHSVFVASELLQLRESHHGHGMEFRIHPPSRGMREKSLIALESVLALPNIERLASPRLRELLEKTGKQLDAIRPGALGS
ncbi:aKG-HExxH-type peptide beta-hydroxylase [Streptomyces meridianus]|uniref:HEXXH motif-containing putative peptide modification protein n=1 Tax=Streptomyces meridianus TaxID=2938945 RepID=A0ABT0XBC7_9ACTN|nr:HEXXH motif-containing putative peptide modification protein [Streptomyces meridianus]MCM2579680.1 HEXXH motif-containing putative peptide modification protein [Streptomyces meridianus]